jgi:hypothetical protein
VFAVSSPGSILLVSRSAAPTGSAKTHPGFSPEIRDFGELRGFAVPSAESKRVREVVGRIMEVTAGVEPDGRVEQVQVGPIRRENAILDRCPSKGKRSDAPVVQFLAEATINQSRDCLLAELFAGASRNRDESTTTWP